MNGDTLRPMNLEMIVGHPNGSPLAEDYQTGRGRARSFFPGDWTDGDGYRSRARAVEARFDREAREAVARMVRAPASSSAAKLERWVEEGGIMVTTGQQPGLFTGPLYSIYKALTAVRLAARLEEMLETAVLPVFWVASEDHDWEEAHDTWIVGVDNELHHVELPPPPEAERDRPLHRVRASAGEALEAFLGHLPETDFRADHAKLLEGCWSGSRMTVPEAFRCTLEALLGPFGMLFVDAHEPLLKAASVPVLQRELRSSAAHETALARRSLALEEAGYHVQVPILEGGVNLFVEGPAGRERLYRDGEGFHLRHSGARLSADQVEEAMTADVATVSPNVLLRPVVEAAVLPTVAYVAGPGETAYFAQLGPLFEAHGVAMPAIVPRLSVTVIESKVRKVLDKFGLEPTSLDRPFHELAGEIARDETPAAVQEALGRLRGAVGQGTAALTQAVREVDPTLKGPISHARTVAFEAIQDVEKKIVQAVKRENEIALQQVEKARLHLYPDGRPQERVLNVFYYLVRYGERFLQALLERFHPLPSSDPDA